MSTLVINDTNFTSLLTAEGNQAHTQTTKFTVTQENSVKFLLLNLKSNNWSVNEESINISICEDDNQTNIFSLANGNIPNNADNAYTLGFLAPGEYCINATTSYDDFDTNSSNGGPDVEVTITTANDSDVITINNNEPVSLLNDDHNDNNETQKYFQIAENSTYYLNYITNGFEFRHNESIKIFNSTDTEIIEIGHEQLSLSPHSIELPAILLPGAYTIKAFTDNDDAYNGEQDISVRIVDSDNIPIDFSLNKVFIKEPERYTTDDDTTAQGNNLNLDPYNPNEYSGYRLETDLNSIDAAIVLKYRVSQKHLDKYNSWNINIDNVLKVDGVYGTEDHNRLHYKLLPNAYTKADINHSGLGSYYIPIYENGNYNINIQPLIDDIKTNNSVTDNNFIHEVNILLQINTVGSTKFHIRLGNYADNLNLTANNQVLYNLENLEEQWTDSNLRILNVYSDNQAALSLNSYTDEIINNSSNYALPDDYSFDSNNYLESIVDIARQNETGNSTLHLLVYKNNEFQLYDVDLENVSVNLSTDPEFDLNTAMETNLKQYYILYSNVEQNVEPVATINYTISMKHKINGLVYSALTQAAETEIIRITKDILLEYFNDVLFVGLLLNLTITLGDINVLLSDGSLIIESSIAMESTEAERELLSDSLENNYLTIGQQLLTLVETETEFTNLTLGTIDNGIIFIGDNADTNNDTPVLNPDTDTNNDTPVLNPDNDTNNDTPVLNPTLPESDICLPAGMPIQTDQGIVEIQNITTKNTIRGLRVLRLVECFNKDTHLISIRRSAFSQGYPKSTVLVSENHGIYTEPQSNVFNRARGLVNNVDVRKVHVGRHKIYNILLEKHSYMYVNGLKVETMSNEHAKRLKLL